MEHLIVELRRGYGLTHIVAAVLQAIPKVKHLVRPAYSPETIESMRTLRERAVKAHRSLQQAMYHHRKPEEQPTGEPGEAYKHIDVLTARRGEAVYYQVNDQRLVHLDAPGPPDRRQPKTPPRQKIVLSRVFQVEVPTHDIALGLQKVLSILPFVRRAEMSEPLRVSSASVWGARQGNGKALVDAPSDLDGSIIDAACTVQLAPQGYLNDDMLGTGVRHSRLTDLVGDSGGKKARLGIVELDFPTDDEVPAQFDDLAFPGLGLDESFMRHAMRDISILIGATLKNGKKVEGIVPGLTSIELMSLTQPGLADTAKNIAGIDLAAAIYNMADALTRSTDLGIGSIMLIEAQISKSGDLRPILVNPDVRQALLYAFGAGVLTVVPACNEPVDIDQLAKEPGYINTGALIVGAASPKQSNGEGQCWDLAQAACGFGDRVDCFSWNGRVASSADLDGGELPDEVEEHTGTSAASAIIAGLACLLQDIYKTASGGVALDHRSLRRWLRLRQVVDTTTSTITVEGGRPATNDFGFPKSNTVGVQPYLPALLRDIASKQPAMAAALLGPAPE